MTGPPGGKGGRPAPRASSCVVAAAPPTHAVSRLLRYEAAALARSRGSEDSHEATRYGPSVARHPTDRRGAVPHGDGLRKLVCSRVSAAFGPGAAAGLGITVNVTGPPAQLHVVFKNSDPASESDDAYLGLAFNRLGSSYRPFGKQHPSNDRWIALELHRAYWPSWRPTRNPETPPGEGHGARHLQVGHEWSRFYRNPACLGQRYRRRQRLQDLEGGLSRPANSIPRRVG